MKQASRLVTCPDCGVAQIPLQLAPRVTRPLASPVSRPDSAAPHRSWGICPRCGYMTPLDPLLSEITDLPSRAECSA